MHRRKFLKALGAVAPAPLIAPAAGFAADDRQAPSNREEPRLFVREDFHHLSGIAPPLARPDVTKTVDLIAGTSVNTLIFSLGSRGGMCLYDTRVGQMHSANTEKWTHPVNYRDALHMHQLVAEGWDRPQLFCDRCHEEGILFFASAPLNIGAHTSDSSRGLGRTSDFVFNNPQLRVGHDSDPRAKTVSPTRLNFMYPEVREERLRIYEEFLARYETDGIEVQSEVLPICKYNETTRCAPLLTEWFRKLKAIAEKAEKAQGRRKRVYARIPAHPKAWEAIGFEVETWISEGLVDGLICSPSDPEVFEQDLDLSTVVALARGSSCRILAGCGTSIQSRVENKATPSMFWAAAANAYHQGAEGFGINDMVRSQELNISGGMYPALRPLASPESLATADKTYHVRDLPKNPNSYGAGLPGTQPLLPKVLEVGKSEEIPMRIADDLRHWESLDRVKSVRLRIRINSLEPSLNELRFEFNGKTLADSSLEITDLNYRFIREGVAYQGSHIFQFTLEPDHYPTPGRNVVTVTLVRRDPAVDMEFQIQDVDCSIEYRHHRHFERDPIQY